MADTCRPPAEWPHLLVGPMVRRVTRNSVSIFIATSVECSAQLGVRAGLLAHDDLHDTDFVSNPLTVLDRLGDRLWVGLLQARLPAESSEGQTFSYDVKLLLPNAALARRLYDLGELGEIEDDFVAAVELDPILGEVPLGYEPGMLPSFVVAPDDVGELRLAHASCRKPHGGVEGEPDAMTILDEVIAHALGLVAPLPPSEVAVGGETISLPEAPPTSNRERPHQLILTGDQIYADDVAAGLGVALTEAGTVLLGWQEQTPGVTPLSAFMVSPGWRTRFLNMAGIVEVPAIGDTDYSANHLLTFADWCSMYIFAWSDALWARDDDKTGVVLPGPEDRLFVTEMVEFTQNIEQLVGQVIPTQYTRWFELARWLDEFSENVAEVWSETLDPAMGFGSSVRRVRRLLANVSTLTMFDDHDITDDWFLNRDVTDKLLGVEEEGAMSRLGPRVLRNGLSAYAIFQHWGNVPSDFGMDEPGDERDWTALGAQLLELWRPQGVDVVTGHVRPPTLGAEPVGAGSDSTRLADSLLGIDIQPSPIPEPGTPRNAFGRMRWDYSIDFGCYRLIALDTRTWRFFPGATPFEWPAATPSIEVSPLDTTARAYLDQVVQTWDDCTDLVSDDRLDTFVQLLRAVQDAAASSVIIETKSLVSDAADLAEELVELTWPAPQAAEAAGRFATYRAEVAALTSRADILWRGGLLLESLATVAVEIDLEPLSRALAGLGTYIESEATGTSRNLALNIGALLGALGGDLVGVFTAQADASRLVREAVNAAGPDVAAALERMVPDGWSESFFRDGSNQLGAGLISKDALLFQLTEAVAAFEPIAALPTEAPIVILSPAPIFGNPLVEVVQRAGLIKTTLGGSSGAVEWDYEAWSVNTPALNDLYTAAKAIPRCVVLSGDVHYANTSVNDVTLLSEDEHFSVSTRYIQLTSSSARNADLKTTKFGFLDDLLWSDAGDFHIVQMALSKLGGGKEAVSSGPSFSGWVVEIAHEWVEDTFSLENLVEWIEDKTENLPKTPLEILRWQIMAPINTSKAWATEVAYGSYQMVDLAKELHEDWRKSLFGDYLFARDVLRQQLIDFYNECGVDPAFGFQVRRTMLRDLRPVRLDLYKARPRYDKYGRESNITQYANIQEVQTVGHSNIGLVRFLTSNGVVGGVAHELLWFPVPELDTKLSSAGLVVGAPVRDDWMGTLHECGWTGTAHRYFAPPSTGPVMS